MRAHLVLAITSPSAFLDVHGVPAFLLALEGLESAGSNFSLSIAVSSKHSQFVQDLLKNEGLGQELLICEPTNSLTLAAALAPRLKNSNAVMLHDASRPFTKPERFEEVIAAFADDIDAVRPAMAFTETLKILDSDSVIQKTLDRSSVFRISTPELIRVSAIDFAGSDCGWFLPLKKDARTLHVEGHPDELRINTLEDRDLMALNGD